MKIEEDAEEAQSWGKQLKERLSIIDERIDDISQAIKDLKKQAKRLQQHEHQE